MYWRVGKVENEARIFIHPLKRAFMLQSKGAHFGKICRRATRGEITFHFLAVLRAAQNGLYTSILLPTPMTIAVGEMMSLSQTIGFQLLPCSSCGLAFVAYSSLFGNLH